MNSTRKQVAVVVGATSKWQSDGRNTKLAHGKALDDSDMPVGVRWGVGGAVSQKFAKEGFFVVPNLINRMLNIGHHYTLEMITNHSENRPWSQLESEFWVSSTLTTRGKIVYFPPGKVV